MPQESERPLEANEADAIEQSLPVEPDADTEPTPSVPFDANDADATEQALPVGVDVDAYPHDADSAETDAPTPE